MKLYLERSLKYILRMIVIIGLVFAVMAMLGLLETEGQGVVKMLFMSTNGIILIVVLLLLAAIYPKLAFGTVTVHADIEQDRNAVIEAMRSYGYSPATQEKDVMVFRADKLSKKLLSQFDDAITIKGEGRSISVEGLKKDILRVESRINAHVLK